MLGISHSTRGQWNVLHVMGELDMGTGPQLRQEIVRHVTAGNFHIVIDLQNIDFIDSTGLGILIGGLKRARSHGGDLRCAGLSDHLKEVFDLTGLGNVFALVDLGEEPSTWEDIE
jgi:anti-sigma B factor antagonist